jgi:hypothetical protein
MDLKKLSATNFTNDITAKCFSHREGREEREAIIKMPKACVKKFEDFPSRDLEIFATSPALHQTQCGASVVSSR